MSENVELSKMKAAQEAQESERNFRSEQLNRAAALVIEKASSVESLAERLARQANSKRVPCDISIVGQDEEQGWIITAETNQHDLSAGTKATTPSTSLLSGLLLASDGTLAMFDSTTQAGELQKVYKGESQQYYDPIDDLTHLPPAANKLFYWSIGEDSQVGIEAIESFLIKFALKHELDV